MEHKGDGPSVNDELKDAHILVVDDDESFRRMIKDVLRQTGIRCSVASSGDEALKLLDREPVDVVIADIHMPGMSGIDALGEIRKRAGSS